MRSGGKEICIPEVLDRLKKKADSKNIIFSNDDRKEIWKSNPVRLLTSQVRLERTV